MSAAEEVAAAWREDMDRLHVGIARLERLVEERTKQRDEALDVLRAVVAEDASPASCPYLARWENRPGHDPEAMCIFWCHEEPECVTGGPWAITRAEQFLDSLS